MSTLPPPHPQADGSVTLWEQIRDNLELKDSFSLMLCPPRDILQAGTVLMSRRHTWLVQQGWGRAHGLASKVTDQLLYTSHYIGTVQ